MVLILEKTRSVNPQNSCFNTKKPNQHLLNEKNTKDGLTQKGAHQCSRHWRDLWRLLLKTRHRSSSPAEQTSPGRPWLPRGGRTAGTRACRERSGACTAGASWACPAGTEPCARWSGTAARSAGPARAQKAPSARAQQHSPACRHSLYRSPHRSETELPGTLPQRCVMCPDWVF